MDQIKLRLGQAVGLKELIATLVVAGLLLIVGTVVFAKVKASMAQNDSPDTCYQQRNNTACFAHYTSANENTTVTGAAASTISNVEGTTYNAFQLATVALIVLAAADHVYENIYGQINNRNFDTNSKYQNSSLAN